MIGIASATMEAMCVCDVNIIIIVYIICSCYVATMEAVSVLLLGCSNFGGGFTSTGGQHPSTCSSEAGADEEVQFELVACDVRAPARA